MSSTNRPTMNTAIFDVPNIAEGNSHILPFPLSRNVRPDHHRLPSSPVPISAGHVVANRYSRPLVKLTISEPPSLLSPYTLSTKLMGTSPILYPSLVARTIISI